MTVHRPIVASPTRVRLTVADFLLLDEAGAFKDYNRTELLDGDVVATDAQHRPHAYVKTELAFRLRDALRKAEIDLGILIEGSVEIQPVSVPQPDIALTDAPRGKGLLPVESLRLAIEVADATFASDRRRKGAIYARGGIPEYWVVDLKRSRIVLLTDPVDGSYHEERQVPIGDPVSSLTLPGLVVETDGLA